MIRRAIWVVCLFWLSGLTFSVAEAQTVQVVGQVVSATGQPVVAAEVVLQSPHAAPATATGDASSRFQFSGLEPGEYRITARAIGHSPVSQVLVVSATPPPM